MIGSVPRCRENRDDQERIIRHQERVIEFLIECLDDERQKHVQGQGSQHTALFRVRSDEFERRDEEEWETDGGAILREPEV